MKRFVYLLCCVSAVAWAQPATRAEVQAQRKSIEQQFARQEAECQQRFAVSACLEASRQARREALAPLVAREHELAAEERQARAAAQAQRVKEREQAASAPIDAQRRERPGPVASAPAASQPVRARNPEQAARAQREAERKAAAEAAQRREEARERELRMQQRLAEHEARQKRRSKPPAAPLPLPGASAVAPASVSPGSRP
jgi:colicin import membrane protein